MKLGGGGGGSFVCPLWRRGYRCPRQNPLFCRRFVCAIGEENNIFIPFALFYSNYILSVSNVLKNVLKM